MTSSFLNTINGVTLVLILGFASIASGQDNPLLQPAGDNPLLQQNTSSAVSAFEAQARAIDLAATKVSSDPVCQNIRANYDQQLAEISEKSQSDGMSLSEISKHSYAGNGILSRTNRLHSNLGGGYSSGLSEASRTISRGTSAINDVAAIGGMLGISGKKMSQKKAAKKVAELDAQAMDAVKQTSCPMSTFN